MFEKHKIKRGKRAERQHRGCVCFIETSDTFCSADLLDGVEIAFILVRLKCRLDLPSFLYDIHRHKEDASDSLSIQSAS